MYAENIEALERALHVRMYTVLILNKSLVMRGSQVLGLFWER